MKNKKAGKPFVYKTFEKKAKVTQYRLKMIEREISIILFQELPNRELVKWFLKNEKKGYYFSHDFRVIFVP
ncbi:TPA: hypothetical protein V1N82_001537 [Streptococcus pneumoniae]|nr:hypothetical protein [Streptococcus pneumoniae]